MRKKNHGFIATAVLYSLVLLLTSVLFIILKNSATTRKNVVEDATNIKESVLKYTVHYEGNHHTSGEIPDDIFLSG